MNEIWINRILVVLVLVLSIAAGYWHTAYEKLLTEYELRITTEVLQ